MTSNAMNNGWLGSGFGWLLGCLLFVVPPPCVAQINLIPNHSFEVRDTCSGLNQVHYPDTGPLGWFSGGWTPDYYQSCLGSGASFGVPLSYWCYQSPQDGEDYVGMMTYDQAMGGREYFMTELLEPLVPGQTYYASFYANAGWGGSEANPQHWLAASRIGLLFTMQPRQWELGDPVPMGTGFAHVNYPGVLADTVQWVLASGSFVADSAYQYVMIGNQFSNAETDTMHFADFPWYPRAHTLVDNVCVSTDPLGCPMATSVQEQVFEAISLYPNPAMDRLTGVGMAQGDRISIADAVGRLVWTGLANGGPLVWDVDAWARGGYVLRIQVATTSRSFKFVLIE